MALPASAMREISVAFYQSATLDPGTEEIVQSIISMAQIVAEQGEWSVAYRGKGFDHLDVGDEPNPMQEDIMDGLASLGYSPRIERLGAGLIVSW